MIDPADVHGDRVADAESKNLCGLKQVRIAVCDYDAPVESFYRDGLGIENCGIAIDVCRASAVRIVVYA